ncbi:MAG: ABC transporter substrate-binding protein [Proteobacteria bacterium]|nr:ABC transporter substrate-binding protein [Pseudomonadota bacterium]MBU1641127.1 ABC transporter substrate-binding protein [Pseudomonadota bacterium]
MLKRIIILLMVLLAIAAVGCQRQQEPIKIGLSINLSGRGGEAGEQIRDGALLAVEEINARGGVKGRPLILLVRDDENSDEGIQRADQSLLDEKVVAIIGHSYSANTIKAYPHITGNNTLMITGYTATTKLTGKDDLFFRTAIDCQVYGQKTAALLKKKGVTSVTFLMDMSNADFVLDYVKQVERNFQGPMAMVQFESRDNVDWQGITDELLAPGPGAIIMLTEASMTAVGVQYIRNHGFSGPVIGTIWTQSPGLLRTGGPASEGMSIISFVDPNNQRPDYLQFSANLEKKFNKPASARSSRAYEMIAILAAGLQKAEKINAQALKTALLEGEFESILGRLRFDQYGDVVRPVYEVVVKEGEFTNGGEIL